MSDAPWKKEETKGSSQIKTFVIKSLKCINMKNTKARLKSSILITLLPDLHSIRSFSKKHRSYRKVVDQLCRLQCLCVIVYYHEVCTFKTCNLLANEISFLVCFVKCGNTLILRLCHDTRCPFTIKETFLIN